MCLLKLLLSGIHDVGVLEASFRPHRLKERVFVFLFTRHHCPAENKLESGPGLVAALLIAISPGYISRSSKCIALYILFVVSLGSQLQRNQVHNAAAMARLLNATVVLPKFVYSTIWINSQISLPTVFYGPNGATVGVGAQHSQWILHDWSDEECVKILKTCKEAIQSTDKEGKIIIIDMIIDDQKEDNEAIETQLHFDMLMMALLTGRERNEKEFATIFYDAGYKIIPILGLRSVIEVYL
ncbi:trans-resveratrol di-O-methyltransferase-like [Olea europaea subsp. europaea]|uniref:Trans-resveratrol di-O-methyltransferase-like n=1 Tax=Olea europaea subsp. europaea TaxID=158383 RepID=A0A8S0QXP0_OLEEU|nr:trans-resveratrol di-O-methyltransferase-like [Olea europaea subsp. europaea]